MYSYSYVYMIDIFIFILYIIIFLYERRRDVNSEGFAWSYLEKAKKKMDEKNT
jgi:hypothetical protein